MPENQNKTNKKKPCVLLAEYTSMALLLGRPDITYFSGFGNQG